MKYYSIHKFAEIIGVTPQTLRNWDKNGKLIPHHKSSNGYRYYSNEQLNQVLHKPNIERKTVGYCRVSSQKQKEDLDRQIENINMYLLAQGKPYEVISEIGSGISYKRKGLERLIKQIALGEVDKVVLMYKDRLVSFGFEMIEYIASLYHCNIEIVNTSEKSEQEELVEDLAQIITAFSGRLHGKRANKAKKMIRELASDD